MHSLNHVELARVVARERTAPDRRRQRVSAPPHPPRPPARARAAYAVARLASRLDRETARRAVV